MEEYKLWYLNLLLSRVPTPEMNLKSYINATRSLEELSRQCYAETIILSSDEFVEIMLLDACFLVELFCDAPMNDLLLCLMILDVWMWSACVVVVSLEAEKPLAIQQVEVAPSHTMEVRIKLFLGMTNNPNFVEEVSPHFGKDNEIIVGCQTGKRLLMVTTDLLSTALTPLDIVSGSNAFGYCFKL
ncbi:hypothetical protein HHK36_006821 [Tetracentron sinense]|uniref:Uncharacterized protein n=1 Tax=Tetracentron sinense TaxID=13715 RepID=A0A835DL94_TETSI|nr:hypothetical protein HHK36_006821 [Tetracentron sinense]